MRGARHTNKCHSPLHFHCCARKIISESVPEMIGGSLYVRERGTITRRLYVTVPPLIASVIQSPRDPPSSWRIVFVRTGLVCPFVLKQRPIRDTKDPRCICLYIVGKSRLLHPHLALEDSLAGDSRIGLSPNGVRMNPRCNGTGVSPLEERLHSLHGFVCSPISRGILDRRRKRCCSLQRMKCMHEYF